MEELSNGWSTSPTSSIKRDERLLRSLALHVELISCH
jgi:hypothetical protein